MENKSSKNKSRILTILQSSNDHPTAYLIHSRFKNKYGDICFATVYNNINSLLKDGLIIDIHKNEQNQSCFDTIVDNHDHFVCQSCDTIWDLDTKKNPQHPKTNHKGWTINYATTKYYGLCQNCSQ